MGIVADICAQEVMQRIGDALCAVPLKAVQVIADGMILILMSSDRQRLADSFFMVQTITVFQIQHEIVEICVVHG